MRHYRYPAVAAAFLFFLILSGGHVIHAQKRTNYYPNGNKQFRGKYELAWPEHERQDRDPAYGFPADYKREYSRRNDLSRLLDLFPEIIYEGKCTFYYPDGEKWYSGVYKHGVKNGRFQYWYTSGRKKAEQYYKNGMASGTWKTWDTSGLLAASFSYQVIPESILAALNSYMQVEMSGGHHRGNQNSFDSLYSSFADRKELSGTWEVTAAHSERLNTFKTFIENNLLQHCVWNGPFSVWKNGKPYLEFVYRDNIPAGTWKIWEEDTLAFQMRFEHGETVSATEYIHRENNREQKEMTERRLQDSVEYALSRDQGVQYTADESPNAVAPGLSTQQHHIFRAVDQMPEYPGGPVVLQQFLKSNLHYTETARAHNIQGRVYVQFIVSSTGRIDSSSIKIQRGLGYGLDKEAVRVIKLMPAWEPGKRNGRSVDVYYIIPISFRLQ